MVNENRRRKTAAELLNELEKNPEYRLRQERLLAQREENRRRYAHAAAGLLADLRAAGFSVDSLAELRDPKVGHKRAVPVLLRWIDRVSYVALKRDLIATLGSPWARPTAAKSLIEEFNRTDPSEDTADTSIRWSIGDALERVADESVIQDLLVIATDARHGAHRGLVVAALGNMKKRPELVVPTLVSLLSDQHVAGYAVMALGKLKAREAAAAIEPFLDHPQSWIRKEAKKALGKLA